MAKGGAFRDETEGYAKGRDFDIQGDGVADIAFRSEVDDGTSSRSAETAYKSSESPNRNEKETIRYAACLVLQRGLSFLFFATLTISLQLFFISDSQVVGCRLSLILDDLLWVLTDSQILAALHFINSLSGLIKQATEMTQKVKAKRKLEVSFFLPAITSMLAK